MADTNVVAIARSTVTFNCSSSGTSTPSRWHYVDYEHQTRVGVYNGRTINAAFHPRYTARFDSTTFSSLLTIGDVRLNDVGTYSCSKLNSSSKISIFHLSVLGIYQRWVNCNLISVPNRKSVAIGVASYGTLRHVPPRGSSLHMHTNLAISIYIYL